MKLEIEVNVPEAKVKEILKDIVILIDSREKVNQHITDYFTANNIKFKEHKLEFGDYSFMVPANEYWQQDIYFTNHILIERKNSLEELSGNFSADRLRLENEFAAIYDKKVKLYVLIENATLNDMITGNYKTDYNKNAFTGSFLSFQDRYNFVTKFIPNNKTGFLIHNICRYYFRNLIK